MPTSVRIERFRGAAAVTLVAGDLRMSFLPEVGMTGASLRLGHHELLVLPGGPRAVAAGHTGGLPLLHPYANRLAGRRYDAAGVAVNLRGLAVHTDPRGLPMHGTLVGRRGWELTALSAGRRSASLTTRFAYDTPDLLAVFPFPHVVELGITLDATTLSVATTVRATAGAAVPISFGWHPYLRVPGPPRQWQLRLPAREHLRLDRRLIPTGVATPEPADEQPLGDRRFDDGYVLGADRHLTVTGRGVRLDVTFDAGYPCAQLYREPDRNFICIEPMTAPTNALVTGTCPVVEPGGSFTATFDIRAAAV